MDNDLKSFIQKAREKKLSNEEIKAKLLAAGWNEETVSAILDDELIAPPPPSQQRDSDAPTPLTKREETVRLKMFEYKIMFLTLWVVAGAMFWIINAILFNSDASIITFPLTALLVCLPIFLILFFRIQSHEETDKELKHVSGRLKLIQSTQSLAFIFLLIHTIFVIYQLLNGSSSMVQQLFSWMGSIIIFGSIFLYYWYDTHEASLRR